MSFKVHYRSLANRLQPLPLEATCTDLAAIISDYLAHDPEYRDRLLGVIAKVPSDGNWIDGLMSLCDALKEDNSRFIPGLFMEWATENL